MTIPASTEEETGLTRLEVNRGLRSFILSNGLFGAWSPCASLGAAAFTGYVLFLGADESFIPLLAGTASLLAILQLIAPILGKHIKNKKHFIVRFGLVEVLLRSATILIPVIFLPPAYLPALVVVIALGLVVQHSISPFHNTWIANTVPEKTRARFTSDQIIVSSIVAIIFGFFVGRFIDLYPEADKLEAFRWVFGVGAVIGAAAYLVLCRAPMARDAKPQAEQISSMRLLVQPFMDTNFRRAVYFYGSWAFSTSVAGSLYSVFMLKWLGVSYTEIALFNAAFLVTSIVGYRAWASLIDRFGSKPVLQILLIPAALTPVLWVFNSPDNYYLIPVALFVAGIFFSGISVAVQPLLFGLLPEGERRPYYLSAWSAAVSIMSALGPFTGSFLVRVLRDVEFTIIDFPIRSLQIIFLISALLRFVPIVILRFVRDRSTLSSRGLLSQMLRGNLMTYLYNATVYNLATGEERRARAALALGRSGSPLAIEQLTHALADASPLVRRSAARALGESRLEAATPRLVQELIDGSSDIRPEAAEALGRLGHVSSVDPLIDALEDADARVRISAIRSLAEMGGPEVHELLYWHFSDQSDAVTFPTLVDVLSQLGDHRVVKPALQRLDEFSSAAIRLQLLNSACRALGAQGEFYRLLSLDDNRRVTVVGRLLARAAGVLTRSSVLDAAVRDRLKEACKELSQAYERERVDALEAAVQRIAAAVRDGLSGAGNEAFQVLSVFLVIVALEDFLKCESRGEFGSAREIFLVVCLSRIGALLREFE